MSLASVFIVYCLKLDFLERLICEIFSGGIHSTMMDYLLLIGDKRVSTAVLGPVQMSNVAYEICC